MIQPGVILAAHPDLTHDFFSQSVILITEHHKFSTVGVCINKTHSLTVSEAAGIDEWPWEDILYQGGPVNRSALIMLHTHEWYSSNTMAVTDKISISSDVLMLEKAASGNAPQQWRFVCGMCGWHPGQLQKEVDQNQWLIITDTDKLIWNLSDGDQWHRAIERYAAQAVKQFF
jgi:putative transcriptional regulator